MQMSKLQLEVQDGLRPEVLTRLDHQIRLQSNSGRVLRSCETNLEFSTLWSVERRSNSGHVCWKVQKWPQGRLLCNESRAAEVEARRQGLSEQERSSATFPVPILTNLRVFQMEKGRCVIETMCLRTVSEVAAWSG